MFRMAALGALVCGLALLSSPASAAEKEDVELLQVFQAEEAAISAKRGKWAQTLEVTQCNRIAGYAKCDFMHEDYPIQIFFMRHHNGWVSGTGEGEYRILWVLRVAAVAALVLGVFLLSLFVLTTGGRRFKAAGCVISDEGTHVSVSNKSNPIKPIAIFRRGSLTTTSWNVLRKRHVSFGETSPIRQLVDAALKRGDVRLITDFEPEVEPAVVGWSRLSNMRFKLWKMRHKDLFAESEQKVEARLQAAVKSGRAAMNKRYGKFGESDLCLDAKLGIFSFIGISKKEVVAYQTDPSVDVRMPHGAVTTRTEGGRSVLDTPQGPVDVGTLFHQFEAMQRIVQLNRSA